MRCHTDLGSLVSFARLQIVGCMDTSLDQCLHAHFHCLNTLFPQTIPLHRLPGEMHNIYNIRADSQFATALAAQTYKVKWRVRHARQKN